MKEAPRFIILCESGGIQFYHPFVIGVSRRELHPLTYQKRWLLRERGAVIDKSARNLLADIHALSVDYDLSFTQLATSLYPTDRYRLGAGEYDAAIMRDRAQKIAREMENKPLTMHKRYGHYTPQACLRLFDSGSVLPIGTGDHLLRGSYNETAEYISELSKMLWQDQDSLALAARGLFTGLALYMIETQDYATPTLSDMFGLLSSEKRLRQLYRLLDVAGGLMSPLAFQLIAETLARQDAYLDELFPYMIMGMADFALDRIRHGRQEFSAAKSAFRQSLLHIQTTREVL